MNDCLSWSCIEFVAANTLHSIACSLSVIQIATIRYSSFIWFYRYTNTLTNKGGLNMLHMKLKSKTNMGTFNNLGYGWRWVTSQDNTTTPIQTLNNRAQQ
jgi:hypothetical protein